MSLRRAMDGPEPIRTDLAGRHEHRPTRSGRVATGTLACPHCDAPVFPGATARSVTAALACPFCGHSGAVRDFLSLAPPSRPARVEVRAVWPADG